MKETYERKHILLFNSTFCLSSPCPPLHSPLPKLWQCPELDLSGAGNQQLLSLPLEFRGPKTCFTLCRMPRCNTRGLEQKWSIWDMNQHPWDAGSSGGGLAHYHSDSPSTFCLSAEDISSVFLLWINLITVSR